MTATDADTEDTLSYRLMAHTDDADDYLSFTIDENTGQLKTKADVDLDFEAQSTYKVMVEVTDSIFTATINVTITVKDVNEAPTFPENTDTRDIAENTIAGVNIGNPVAATDPDTADGDTDVNPDDSNVDALTYSLGGTDAASFDIDTTTGQLKTKAALDYETKDDYEVTVTASDGSTNTASITITINIIDVDDTPPTVEITSATTVQNDAFGVTFTFSEAVSGFVASDISLTTTLTEGTGSAAIGNLTLVTGSDTQYTAEITPPTNAEGRITIQVPASAAQDAATNRNTASSEYTVPVDTIIPSTTITAPTTVTGTFSVTITFSEDMTEFDNLATDIMLSGRATATVTSLTGSGATYTANITPTSNGNLKISVPKNVAKDKANNGNTASQSHTVSIGLTGPSVAIQGVPTDPQNSAFTITIIFSELVTGFDDAATDISLGTDVSATVTSLTGSGMTYTATITPADAVEEKITLSVPAGAAVDTTNMDNTASLESTIQLDNVQPSVTITVPTTAAGAFDVTITFSENVTGFAQSDISLTDSTATAAFTNFVVENAKEYTATITPTTNGSVVVSVPAEVAKDVAENQNTESNRATVTVDFNEAPVFNTGLNTTPTIAENTAAGTNIGTPLTATDADTEDTLTYSLKAHANDADDYLSFTIDENTGQLKTKANVDLDFETQSTYKVTVEVSDSVATAAIDVTITITNVNEAPMFDAETATRTVAENISQNQAFGAAVTATDPDAADTLTYSLEAYTDAPTDVNLFDIGSTTGQLKTKEGVNPNLDFEGDKTTYTLVVKVTDSGNLTDTITVTITVTDVDEPPAVSIDAAQAVKDNPQNGKFEVTVTFSEAVNNFTASDIALTTTLTEGTGNATVTLKDASDGDTVYTAEITPPANAEGEVKIQVSAGGAQDTANQDNTASLEFTVDIDTKSPTVSITGVPSTTENDTFEVTITFSEEVTLTNAGNITTSGSVSRVYSLSGTGSTHTATLSRVDDKDGNVILKVPAGFAKDSAGNLNTESSQHTVSVDWKDPTVTVTAPSSTQTGAFDITIIFSETVTDFGQGDISLTDNTATTTVTGFTMVSGAEYTAEITPTTNGDVKIKVPADAAQDAANNGNIESDTLTVAVTISSNPNDKIDPPDAIMIASQNNVKQPDQTVTPGIFALIMDFGEPVTGFEQSELGINEFQTDVTMTGWQADADGKKYTATFNAVGTGSVTFTVPEDAVEAVDNGVGNRERKLFVFIRDNAIEANRAPVFATDTVMRTIAENTEIGTAIGAPVTATDPDNDTLRYSLEAHDDAPSDYKVFSIGYNSGQLKTSKPLDHETQSIYKLTVKVSDNRRGVDTVAVTITVTDVAEDQPNRAPVFAADSTTREIAESTASNQPIGAKITATDPDGDALTYSLKAHDDAPNDYKAFSIQSTSTGGQLKTKAALDYETQSTYKVIVEVSDSKGGTDTINVTINVTDVDEALPNRPPAFALESTTRSIGETTIAGVKIGEPVSATDPDDDTLIYSLEGTDAASFKIVESTGQLKTKVELDREVKPQYTVTAKVDDGNGGTDTIIVTINIHAPDRPEPIMFVKQNGVVKHDQMVTPGTFELVMDFAQPVTGFEKGELGIDALHTTITITGWKVSNDRSDYIATLHAENNGSVTFTVPENALQATDDGQTNAEWKLFVMVIDNAAPTSRKGTLVPTETLLFPNYPNPFNPETWIPYHLANASDVQITIYNTGGSVVRILDLGHQAARHYTSRNRAAYWDGTNEFGESVASGVYFYTLIAGDFSATRRMLILK